MTITLDRAAFDAWLATLPPTEPFAMALSKFCCPLARFLRAQGVNSPIAGLDWYLSDTYHDTPVWAVRFIEIVDETLGYHITPEQALSVLATIPEEATL